MFKFTEEQIMIRDMVREFTKNEVEPRDKWMDENGFDWDIHKKLCEAGLMGIHLPEQYGGGGGDAVTSEIVINEIAKGSASVALFLDADWLAADMIYVHGSDEQKAKYLPLAAEGKIFAFGLTESCAGSDAACGPWPAPALAHSWARSSISSGVAASGSPVNAGTATSSTVTVTSGNSSPHSNARYSSTSWLVGW